MTLSSLLTEKARKIPKKTCIKFEKRKLTYADLDEAVNVTAGGLSKLGLNVKDRAAILMENCAEYIVSYFAVLRAGGITIPVNTFLTPKEISYILNDSGCKILIYSKKFLPHIEKIKIDKPDLTAVDFKDIPQQDFSPYTGSSDETAVIIYTSGTTGFPKGAMLTHRNLLSNAEACSKFMHLSRKDKVLLFLPLFHSFSFTVCVVLPIFYGITITMLASVKPFSKIINCIIRDRITLFVAIPAVYDILSKIKMPFMLSYFFKFIMNIRICVSGSAALPAHTLHIFEKRFKVPLLEGYGLTEASPVVSVNPLRGVRKPGSVGIPLPGVEVAIIGEDGSRLKAGKTGELIVKGPNIMKGYFNKDLETREVLREGWLYTGDMAKVDEDGYIYIIDRKKDLIIHDGMNIYPREVEDLVVQHPSVDEGAMIGLPSNRGTELPVLFIKAAGNAVVDETEIRNYLKDRIARFKMPRRIIFVDEFPKTATGKIKKTELRKSGDLSESRDY